MNDPYAIDVPTVSGPAALAERQAARRAAAARATSAAELGILLDMLGLLPDDDASATGAPARPLRPRLR
ncbi:hypothetical protein ACFWUQ_06365 [Streptomyces sp. NPDC058662]|uniref:hypothetical protein n=1 Tax=Streptomyces sp. NPDC058662 TaxID=3346583 RepID=UPI00366299D9